MDYCCHNRVSQIQVIFMRSSINWSPLSHNTIAQRSRAGIANLQHTCLKYCCACGAHEGGSKAGKGGKVWGRAWDQRGVLLPSWEAHREWGWESRTHPTTCIPFTCSTANTTPLNSVIFTTAHPEKRLAVELPRPSPTQWPHTKTYVPTKSFKFEEPRWSRTLCTSTCTPPVSSKY